MPNTPQGQYEILKLVLLFVGTALFGAVGGGVKHLADTLDKDGAVKRVLYIQSFIGSFSGTIAAIFLFDREFSVAMMFVGAGVAGFGGAVFLRMVLKAGQRYLPPSIAGTDERRYYARDDERHDYEYKGDRQDEER